MQFSSSWRRVHSDSYKNIPVEKVTKKQRRRYAALDEIQIRRGWFREFLGRGTRN